MSKSHAGTRKEQLQDAIKEAKRFIKKAQETLLTIDAGTFDYFHSPELAAAKRASMDLQKTLVAIRKKVDSRIIREVNDVLDDL